MASEQDRDTKMLIGFVVGAATIGLVVYLLIRSLRETLAGLGGPANGQPITINNFPANQAPVALPVQRSADDR